MVLQPTTSPQQWHALGQSEVRALLRTTDQGLSVEEARTRLLDLGPNEIQERPPDRWYQVLLRQFRSPMILFLLAAAVITLFLHEWFDSFVILLTLLLNASLGFWQERKAEHDVKALRQLTVAEATVVRSGTAERIAARELVAGDLVRLESGDKVPADLRLTDVHDLQINESMLTGEVLPVLKSTGPHPEDTDLSDRLNMAYSGTLVASGRASGTVVATALDTELGAIAQSVQVKAQKTPLQKLTDRLEKYIAVVVIAVAALISVVSVPLGTTASEAFRNAVALIVSALPEALPIVFTVTLGVGVSRMAKHRAVIRNLPSVETLGSTDIIGSDKTGTLTINRMTVEKLWTPDGQELDVTRLPGDGSALSATQRRSLRTGALSNEAEPRAGTDQEFGLVGDAVDVAMAAAGLRTGAVSAGERETGPVAANAYEPEKKYSQAMFRTADGHVLHVKGAPETILDFCSSMDTPEGPVPLDGEMIQQASQELGGRGLRVIATASVEVPAAEYGESLDEPRGLTFTGLQGMMDPPREGVKQAIADCQSAGIRVMMITGDHPGTAEAIGRRLGLRSRLGPLTGAEMARLDDSELRGRLRDTSIAARMSPQDKLRIVQVLQEAENIVAITGDGVNDAPALRAAAVGIAMGKSGTDVARESADLVLADDNFVTIVEAVRQGRVTFASIRKATHFLLANGLAAMLAVALNTFSDLPLIFLPAMLIFMNVITNGIQDIALGFERGEGDELRQPPRSQSEGILGRTMLIRTLVTGTWMGLGTLLVYNLAQDAGFALDHARTLALITMVMFNFFNVFNSRAERVSLFRLNPFGNPLLLISSFAALLLQWGAMSWEVSAELIGLAPLSAAEWLFCTAVGATVMVLVEVEKLIRQIVARRSPTDSEKG
ncbi:HAD family hydrolase [Corynebacterium hylobatis]|uniref:HAD family hydrolase n=1 Tax=Corynebacterium hylobatis TaxID=1859290 RepID=A0A3S0AWS8_9CORY|nr:HAD-IC family P-type ATPase [Corynebacterium hylobatis]RSZ64199.1 HAD family hydrolase [Corynebacterium hylobatis]